MNVYIAIEFDVDTPVINEKANVYATILQFDETMNEELRKSLVRALARTVETTILERIKV